MSLLASMTNAELVKARTLFLDMLRGSERIRALLGVVDSPPHPVVELLERVEAEMARRKLSIQRPLTN